MNKFIRNIDKVYSIILSILTIAMDKHWILFMVLLLLNVLDTLTGWIKSRINNKENSILNCKMKLELRNWDKGACPFIPIRAVAGPLFSIFV